MVLWLGIALLAGSCRETESLPVIELVQDGAALQLSNPGPVAWEIAGDWEEPLYWIESLGPNGWTWLDPECPHERDRHPPYTVEPGGILVTESLQGLPDKGTYRMTAWARRPGRPWIAVHSPRIEAPHEWKEGFGRWKGWYPEWGDEIRLVVTEVQVPPPWKEKPKRHAFSFDLLIENGLDVEVEYNPSSNYWLCEGFGGWAQHPGSTICGNFDSFPIIPANATDPHGWFGYGFGRFRFGMGFKTADGKFVGALSEPFEVRAPVGKR